MVKKPLSKNVKNKKTAPKEKKMAKKPDVIEVQESSEPKPSASDIISALKAKCEEMEAQGFIFAIVDANGVIIPYAGGKGLGEILLMQKLISKEIDRITDSILSKPA